MLWGVLHSAPGSCRLPAACLHMARLESLPVSSGYERQDSSLRREAAAHLPPRLESGIRSIHDIRPPRRLDQVPGADMAAKDSSHSGCMARLLPGCQGDNRPQQGRVPPSLCSGLLMQMSCCLSAGSDPCAAAGRRGLISLHILMGSRLTGAAEGGGQIQPLLCTSRQWRPGGRLCHVKECLQAHWGCSIRLPARWRR